MSAGDRGLPIHVVAAAIINAAGSVLIAQRPPGKHLAGGWEFPGGKVDPGETPLEALSRELLEELGIQMGAGPHRPVRRVRHAYPDREVLIEVWMVREFRGVPRGLDGQAIRWCPLDDLYAVPLLPADNPIIQALRLPERLVESNTAVYSIGTRTPAKLFGAMCSTKSDVMDAERAGADFVVMRTAVSAIESFNICRDTVLPVFACDISLAEAWVLGASGVCALTSQVTGF